MAKQKHHAAMQKTPCEPLKPALWVTIATTAQPAASWQRRAEPRGEQSALWFRYGPPCESMAMWVTRRRVRSKSAVQAEKTSGVIHQTEETFQSLTVKLRLLCPTAEDRTSESTLKSSRHRIIPSLQSVMSNWCAATSAVPVVSHPVKSLSLTFSFTPGR